MSEVNTEPVRCCVCGGGPGEPFAAGWDFEYATTRQEFTFRRCDDCGHAFLSPRPTLDELSTIYPPDYYAYDLTTRVNPLALAIKHRLERQKIRGYLERVNEQRPVCLDIGCGDGRTLDMLHALGAPRENLWGLELDASVLARLADRGYRTLLGPVENCELPEAAFDLIIILQVIEHVADPRTLLQSIRRALKPGGVLVIETPNIESLDAWVFQRRYWGGYHFPRHWNLFSAASLDRLARDVGFVPLRSETFVCAVFWVYPFHHWLRAHGAPRSVYRFFWPLSNPVLLAAATAIDLVLAPFGRTSNLRGFFTTE